MIYRSNGGKNMMLIPIWLFVIIVLPYAIGLIFFLIYLFAGIHDLIVADKVSKGKVECPYEIEGHDEIH